MTNVVEPMEQRRLAFDPLGPRYVQVHPSECVGGGETDVIVIGGGVAGISAALEAARHGRVLIVTKGPLEESNTRYAQGGIAAVLGEDDSVEAHVDDTMRAGAGLLRPRPGK